MKPLETDESESDYRRGYRDGFISAISNVYEMWRYGKEKVHSHLFSFWQGELSDWENSKDYDPDNHPPEPNTIEKS